LRKQKICAENIDSAITSPYMFVANDALIIRMIIKTTNVH